MCYDSANSAGLSDLSELIDVRIFFSRVLERISGAVKTHQLLKDCVYVPVHYGSRIREPTTDQDGWS